ncbi:UrcA family protein [Paramuribaculum intestinale]|uniref:UrcA family protein n=1 Tax=Paramuribaculum intestinale TaxID=2094151 RepID=UPI0027298CDD|nr:UrcA family protein [Paramuribaculum intestinale]
MRNPLILAASMIAAAATASTPVMGWSSWNSFRVDISDLELQEPAGVRDLVARQRGIIT